MVFVEVIRSPRAVEYYVGVDEATVLALSEAREAPHREVSREEVDTLDVSPSIISRRVNEVLHGESKIALICVQ